MYKLLSSALHHLAHIIDAVQQQRHAAITYDDELPKTPAIPDNDAAQENG